MDIMKKFLKKLFIIGLFIFPIFSIVFATDDQFAIIPENVTGSENLGDIVENVAVWWEVWQRYNEKAENLSLWDQFATGIMTRDTLLDYATYLVRFIGQIALFVAALAIIFLWYKKATTILTEWWKSTALVKVISWLLVVIFAYVIVKTVVSMFIS